MGSLQPLQTCSVNRSKYFKREKKQKRKIIYYEPVQYGDPKSSNLKCHCKKNGFCQDAV